MAKNEKWGSVDYSALSLEELITLRRQRASTVNKQLQRWRSAGLAEKGSAYKMYAQSYLRQFGPDRATFHAGRTQIAKAGTTEYQSRRKEIAELKALARYHDAPTYSISGYEKVKRKALQGLAQASGIELGSDEMTRFLESAADGIVGSDQWNWVKWTLGSEAIKAVAKGIAQGNATKAEIIDRIKTMQMREAADRVQYSDMTWEDLMDQLGIEDDQISESEE